jgi:Trk-type K+ transport system membrane component
MSSFKKIYSVIFAALFFILSVNIAQACPNCKEAFSETSTTSKEQMGGATKGKDAPKVQQSSVGNSYSMSILLMLGTPIFVIGGIGFVIYNQAQKGKKVQAHHAITLN